MKILLLFTYRSSLDQWKKLGIIDRELLLYKKLALMGVNYKFLTYGNHKELEFKPSIKKICIIPVKSVIESINPILMLIKSLFLPLKLKSKFKNVDIIKSNQMLGSWVGVIAKILYRKKLIVRSGYECLRNHINFFKITNKKKNFLKYIINFIYIFFIELIAYKLADVIISTNNSDIDFIVKTFKLKKKSKKIIKISNYVDINSFKPLDIKKKEKHILYIGRLSLEKNLINLFNAMKNLKGFTLDIIGSGELENELKIKAKKSNLKINFLGTIPNEKLPLIINQYKLLVLPSYYECNPKVLLEAMSCGIPTISSNVRGINDIITHKGNGYLSNLDNISISKAIKKVYEDQILREKMGKNARNYILANYNLEKLVKREYLLYKRILKNNQKKLI